jgi:hypothetical protein
LVISKLSRPLLYLLAALFGLLGAVLFIAPGWSAANFPWNISPMVAMTMGGWSLGNAYTAWHTAGRERASLVYPGLLYLTLFGVFQALVLVAFRARLVLAAPLAWPYILALVLSILAGGLGFLDWLRLRSETDVEGPPASSFVRGLAVLFVLFVGALALIGVFAPAGSFATEGVIFPEPLTLFTLRAFAAFYGALSGSVIPLIWSRRLDPLLFQGKNGLALILTILLAAIVNLGQFDLVNRPGGLLYIGAYIVSLVILVPILLRTRDSASYREMEAANR